MFTFIHPETTITMTDDLSSIFGTEEKQNWQTSWVSNVNWLIDLVNDLGDHATDYITDIRTIADQLLEGDTIRDEVEEFADNHGVHNLMFLQDYKTAVEELSESIVEEFLEDFGMDMIEHAPEMYQGEYSSGAEFAESIVSDCYDTRDYPTWVQIDWEKTWDYALSYDYTITESGYVFNSNY